jgi:hypothetical protein
LSALYVDLEGGLTLDEALDNNYSLQAVMESCTDIYDAVYELWDAIDAGSTFDDAYDLYEIDLEDATTTCAEYVVENDIDLDDIV